MSDRLTGYQLIAALTENALNAQIARLSAINVIKGSWSQDFGSIFSKSSLSVTQMGAPYVSFSVTDSSFHDIILILPLNAGTFTKNGVALPFTNWTFGFKTNMAMAPLSDADLQARVAQGTSPSDVQTAIQQAQLDLDTVFSVSHLFMDFENTNFAEFDVAHTNIDLSNVPEDERADTMTDIINTLTAYFRSLAGTANPYIMGYPLQSPPPSAPASSTAAPTWTPTSLNFSVTPNDQGLGTLNFLFMTLGDAAPTETSAGIFNTPWVTDNNSDGVFVVDSTLYLGQIVPSLLSGFGSFTFSNFALQSDNSYLMTNGKVTLGELAGGSLTVNIHSDDGSSTMQADFTFTITKDVSIIPGADQVTQTSTWTAKLSVKSDDTGVITATIDSVSHPVTTYDQDKKWWSFLLDLFPVFAIADAIDSIVQMNSFPNAKNGVADLGTTKLTLVMPAGDVFLFKDSHFDGEVNLLVDITYNT